MRIRVHITCGGEKVATPSTDASPGPDLDLIVSY